MLIQYSLCSEFKSHWEPRIRSFVPDQTNKLKTQLAKIENTLLEKPTN